MSEISETTFGHIVKKVVEATHPPTVADSNGKNIMSRREAGLLIILITSAGGGGTYLVADAKIAKAQGIQEQKVITMKEDISELKTKKADEALVNARFNDVQNQLNTIEAQGVENKQELKDIKEQTADTYTSVQVLLERIPAR